LVAPEVLQPQPVLPAATQLDERPDAAVQRLRIDVRMRADGHGAASKARRHGALGASGDVLDAHRGGVAAEGVDRAIEVALRILDAPQRARLVEVLVRIDKARHHELAVEVHDAHAAFGGDAGREALDAAVVADQDVDSLVVHSSVA
jgi:hypothetical protein